MENNNDKKLYTLLVYSENIAGILNQITAVFTRRQVNIESLNVSASSIKNIHKYTITVWSDAEQIEKINKAIEKKIDVVKSDYYADDQIFIHEVALYKISTPILLENPEVSRTIRKHDARMMEVNPTYSTVLLAGLTEDIADLFHQLNSFDCLLQYSRSGRIAVTRSFDEPISDYLKKNSEEESRTGILKEYIDSGTNRFKRGKSLCLPGWKTKSRGIFSFLYVIKI